MDTKQDFIFKEIKFRVIWVKGLANLQGAVGNLVTEEFEGLNLSLGIEEVGVIEYVNKPLIVLVAGLDASFCPLRVIVYLTDAVGKTSFNIKADKYAKMLVL